MSLFVRRPRTRSKTPDLLAVPNADCIAIVHGVASLYLFCLLILCKASAAVLRTSSSAS